MVIVDADTPKSLLRREMKARRAASATADLLAGDRMAQAVAEALDDLDLWPADDTVIAGYYPIQSEINPLPLMQMFEERGYALALPCLLPQDGGFIMQFRRFRLGDALEIGPFGIHQPHADAETVTPGLVLAPMLGFTRDGHRLGYGGGYYDRALEGLRAAGEVRLCGVAFSAQELAELPFEVHDQRLDEIFTERGVIEARPAARIG